METEQATHILSALAQDTRLSLVRRLVRAGRTGRSAGALSEDLGVPPATLSFHLKELANAGVVRSRREGRSVIYVAELDRMNALVRFLMENCCRDEGDPAMEVCDEADACCPVGD